MTAYDNPLAEALASLDGCTITVEKKGDNALLLHIARSSRSRRKQGGSADLTIRLNTAYRRALSTHTPGEM